MTTTNYRLHCNSKVRVQNIVQALCKIVLKLDKFKEAICLSCCPLSQSYFVTDSNAMWIVNVRSVMCRIALLSVYLFIATFVIVDLFLVSHSAYNLVSLAGMLVFLTVLFVFSHSPAKVSAIHTVHGNSYHL